MAPGDQNRYVVLALPFGKANQADRRKGGPYRLWATDFALLEQKRTEEEIEQWHRENGISIDRFGLEIDSWR